ncbi:N2,N2-dimethylguanosine tRNA methyltransferase [Cryphonectria parasitica EP155]|uniref:tRNA (guanine(26)-N(2))-dimethyltransferase n=1 Tax=Cryphonectria parasitica (strain ATCC 38755 / EP155) TaxID=660469 RepID=A0A9P5CRK5_CRYP1|nr:N2,N2-dimethylguanosine tRNA methyltransferase [Cryphonectria parasitica EP155]KAF3767627.1 N2,N2-dimethylguanosine tRNA methyltransferase [Cryphonectria parasitica EP155]
MTDEAKTIDTAPAAGQRITHDSKTYTTVQEGRGYILVPDTTGQKEEGGKKQVVNNAGGVQQVFYNPIQQFNRDLTVFAIKAYGEEVVEKRRVRQEKNIQKAAGKRKRAEERKAAAGDGVNKRKRDENEAQEGSNKAARPDEATSPQESRVNASDAAEKSHGQNDAAEGQPGETKEAAGEDGEPKVDRSLPRFTILDALSATGLRALRYAHEIPFVSKVTANDLDPSAAEAISRNVRHNKLQKAIEVTRGNAIAHMYNKVAAHMALSERDRAKGKTEKYDVVDLDPYGTAATFFDAAVQAVRDDGGLLCVTCTDAGVWASNGYPEKCFALYGGVPMKGYQSHEAGLRLILHGIATSAARYGLTIDPLLSLSIDFYARVFVKVTKSPAAVKFAAGKTMMVYNCDAGCGAWTTQLLLKNRSCPNQKGSGTFYKHQFIQAPTAGENCEHCGFKTHLAGPMYAGRMHDPEFIRRILEKLPDADKTVYGTTDRIKGMLTTALEEHLEEADPKLRPETREQKYAEIEPYPFFLMPTQLAKTVHCATPSEDAFRGALRGLGYRVTRSHCKPGSVKTDAPFSVLWHVIREWIRQKAPIKVEGVKPGSPGWQILKLGQGTKEKEDRKEEVEENKNGSDHPVTAAKDETKGDNEAEKEKPVEVVFDEKLGREQNKERLVRYQMNPRENWGPMNRARG